MGDRRRGFEIGRRKSTFGASQSARPIALQSALPFAIANGIADCVGPN
jgi:hypothetical protein